MVFLSLSIPYAVSILSPELRSAGTCIAKKTSTLGARRVTR